MVEQKEHLTNSIVQGVSKDLQHFYDDVRALREDVRYNNGVETEDEEFLSNKLKKKLGTAKPQPSSQLNDATALEEKEHSHENQENKEENVNAGDEDKIESKDAPQQQHEVEEIK